MVVSYPIDKLRLGKPRNVLMHAEGIGRFCCKSRSAVWFALRL